MTSAPGNWSATITDQLDIVRAPSESGITSLLWPIFLFRCRYQVFFEGARVPSGTTRHFGQDGKRDAAHLACLIDGLALIIAWFEDEMGDHALFSLIIGESLLNR